MALWGGRFEKGVDRLLVLVGDNPLLGEHLRVGPGAGDVLLRHGLVHLKGRAELLREGVDALLEPTTPKRHAPSLCLLAKSSQPDYLTAVSVAMRGNAAATWAALLANNTQV